MKLKYYLKKKYNQFRFNLCANENPLYLFFYKYLYRPPKNSLSEFLDKYSKKNAPLTFLQIGANDGFIYDPIQKFIKRDNWKGIMLEPQPFVFKQYLTKIHAKRKEILPINAAFSANDGKTLLYTLAFSKERWATGLSSFNKAVLLEKIKDETILKKAKKEGVSLPANEKDWIQAIEIDSISPSTLISKFGKEKIDLLAIDTEGFDFEIIKMLDLSKISPEVIIFEEIHFDQPTINACQTYLKNYGYTYNRIGKNVYAKKF